MRKIWNLSVPQTAAITVREIMSDNGNIMTNK